MQKNPKRRCRPKSYRDMLDISLAQFIPLLASLLCHLKMIALGENCLKVYLRKAIFLTTCLRSSPL